MLARSEGRPARLAVLVGALGLVVACAWLAGRLGSEFIPSLDEGDIALHALRIPGTSLTQAVHMQSQLEATLKTAPEVARAFAKIGTAEVATDPMPPNVADTFVMLKPRAEWPDPGKPKAAVVRDLERLAAGVPGNNYEFTQPIQMRFNELISGVRADVALKVYGDDLAVLDGVAAQLEQLMGAVPGAADVKTEQTTGLPILTVTPRREVLARYGLNVADVQALVAAAYGGQTAGVVYEGDRRSDIVLRLPEAAREAEALRRAAEEAMRPFDLARGPLLRSALLRLDAARHVACHAEYAVRCIAHGPHRSQRKGRPRRAALRRERRPGQDRLAARGCSCS